MDKNLLLKATLLTLAVIAALVSYDPNPPSLSIKIEQAKAKTISPAIVTKTNTKKEIKITEKKVIEKVHDFPYIIACRNQITGEIKKPINPNPDDGGCFYGKNWKNLMFPSRAQLKDLKAVYGNRQGIITAITLINHESQFDSNAKGCHKGGCDYGILQIRDVNGGKNMTDREQMEWFKNRKAWQVSPKGNCSQHVGNQERLLRCVFARHNGVLDWFAKYPSDRLSEWRFYSTLEF